MTDSSAQDRAKAERFELLKQWIAGLDPSLGLRADSLRTASDDASFRRYFRLDCTPSAATGHASTLIAMDAPPPMEDCRPFVHATRVLARAGVHAPALLAEDLARGFLLLEDFGVRTYLAELNAQTAPALYRDACRSLVRLQKASLAYTEAERFPPYDRAVLLREMQLWPDWYLARHKGITLDGAERATVDAAFEKIIQNNLAQPRVTLHRDYHSRNLMILDGEANPGVLDYQDALHGPITYDLVSLLRDAYIRWEEPQQLDWAIRYWEMARAEGLPVAQDFADFWRDFEWMGLQRHLKVLGIFARLYHRDGKSRYLADLPLVLDHVLKVTRRYVELAPFNALIEKIEKRVPLAGYTF